MGDEPLDDEVDDSLRYDVGQAEEGARDDDEAENDGRRLSDLAPVGPVHALELCPACAKEVEEPKAGGLLRVGGDGDVAGSLAKAPAPTQRASSSLSR